MIQWMLAIWSLVPLPFLNPAWTSGSSQFTYCWNLVWRIFHITLLVCELIATVLQFKRYLELPCFGIGRKIDLFQSCGHCWVFQICWHIECSTSTASRKTSHCHLNRRSLICKLYQQWLICSLLGVEKGASQVAQWQRICLPMQETRVPSLGWEGPLEEEMATHSSVLAWEIQWTEKPGRLQSMV